MPHPLLKSFQNDFHYGKIFLRGIRSSHLSIKGYFQHSIYLLLNNGGTSSKTSPQYLHNSTWSCTWHTVWKKRRNCCQSTDQIQLALPLSWTRKICTEPNYNNCHIWKAQGILRIFVTSFFFFHGEVLLVLCPTPKLEDHPLSVVGNLFNIFTATHHTWRASPPSATWGHAMPWWHGTHLAAQLAAFQEGLSSMSECVSHMKDKSFIFTFLLQRRDTKFPASLHHRNLKYTV
jgi:hypothetical protein